MTISRSRFRELLAFEDRDVALISSRDEAMGDYVIEHLRLRIGGEDVRGILTRPAGQSGPLPAILYGHSHGGGYAIGASELLEGREYLLDPLGPVFGERATASESAVAKALLWQGKSLFGDMLSDHAAALSYLAGRPDVDAGRIGAFGLSMGCVLSYWLAALDERIAAVAHLCCFADFRTMIALGAHDGHGIYLTVPGLLREADGGTIAGLVAPRPQLICVGEEDALSPMPAVEKALRELRPAYRGNEARLDFLSEAGVGHRETQRMRAAVLEFFGKWLG